jgi:hypothetical protein
MRTIPLSNYCARPTARAYRDQPISFLLRECTANSLAVVKQCRALRNLREQQRAGSNDEYRVVERCMNSQRKRHGQTKCSCKTCGEYRSEA